MNYSKATVCVLASKKAQEEYLREYLKSLEESGDNVEFFDNPDECIQSLISTQDQKYLLILGSGLCHLVDMLSSLPCILYIYLTELHNYEDPSHVRGIYSEPKQLLIKLKTDIKMIEDNDLNFSISSSTEGNMSGTTTKDIQDDKLAFDWGRVILYSVLNTRRPTENIYEEMLQECRDIYQGNSSVRQQIDDFEKTYDPNNVIFWYTKDSFLYRLVNAAFRTEKIPTIWKFRFIIQDIHKRLQTNVKYFLFGGTSSNIHHLYRGQRMTSNELKQIKDNVGHLIAMNSFLSTSEHYDLAKIWSGNGEDRPKFESVIFEIIIDEDKLKSVPIIFANITAESNFPEEKEVLLAMGTRLRIESVELEGHIWKICLHAYPFDDSLSRNVETRFPELHSSVLSDDKSAQLIIATTLLDMGNFEAAEQISQQMSSSKNPVIKIYRNFLKGYIDIYRILSTADPIQSTDIKDKLYETKEHINKIKQSLQQLKQLISPRVYSYFIRIEKQLKTFDMAIEQLLLMPLETNISDVLRFMEPIISQAIRQREVVISTHDMALNNLSMTNPMDLIDVMSQYNETLGLMTVEEMQPAINQNFTKNNPQRIGLLLMTAMKATEENKYDEAIKCLRDALLIPCTDDERASVYRQLAEVYEKQKNWPAALENYENIFRMPQLSKASSNLRLAHISTAKIYADIGDDRNAIVHYKSGVQLYCQHKSSRHRHVGSLKMLIGLKFKKLGDMDAALKTFEEVIDLDHPDQVKDAYKQIGMIYFLRKDYDMAYYNFIESLNISQREIPPDSDFIIDTHLHLARTQYLRNHFDEGCLHMSVIEDMSENHKCTEATQQQIQFL
ncbi:unnamed protein product, partial [Rotaria magnacalcarata]